MRAIAVTSFDTAEPKTFFDFAHDTYTETFERLERVRDEFAKVGHGTAFNAEPTRMMFQTGVKISTKALKLIEESKIEPSKLEVVPQSAKILKDVAVKIEESMFRQLQGTYPAKDLRDAGVPAMYLETWVNYRKRQSDLWALQQRLLKAQSEGAPVKEVEKIQAEFDALKK